MKNPAPGPWVLEEPMPGTGLWRVRFPDESGEEDKGVAVVASEANARLIASAPELLAALKGLTEDDLYSTEYFEMARKAIARAEGRIEDEDPTPYCACCGAKQAKHCACPPRAEND